MKKLLLVLCIILFPSIAKAVDEWEAQIAIAIAIQTLPTATPTPTPVTPTVVPGDTVPVMPPAQPAIIPKEVPQEPQKLYKVRPWPFKRYADNDNTSRVVENNIHSGDVCNLSYKE